MADDPIHPIQPKLEQPDVRLQNRLDEVSEEISISEAETSELMQIEEALAYASEVTKQAISLRRRIDADGGTQPLA
jgi:hypothetical protein